MKEKIKKIEDIDKEIRVVNLEQKNRFLGIDFGEKRVGIAISDETFSISTPKQIILNNTDLINNILKILSENKINHIVIGYSLKMDGQKNVVTEKIEEFANHLKKNTENISIFYGEERLTSFEARSYARPNKGKKRKFYDDIAASIILQEFLDQINQ